ncbi:MAG TPA: hypothetical protein DDW94_09150 [Deltaproteobacteria bacterium]|nr:MAG: hypothetical protein A2Z79_03655 [Deltaproteobacteria bacterium GWA2_55_82]OGQ63643.1 MAG: hypothetical protein A3I81_02755 [Deltaproteobacteria bacterium RIFCSPLOWO2_02_FULL_55_12]OIJ74480.1 MAG: hypothetical protein A2V21_309555 [Deltaproteobacteria bacterium GWC2_55_46]HBG47137.1 hypothetical protein [Deltaproteobacteria bacterium]HCY10802.1 hypothetical protein [Deltaproteobacteria bacterium]
MDRIFEKLKEHLETFIDKLLEFIPDLLVILIIAVSGFIAAAFVEFLLLKGFRAVRLDAWSDQIGLTTGFRKAGIKGPPSAFIGSFIYWFIVVLFFMAGFATLGYKVTDALVSVFFLYLPRFFSAVIIVFLGCFIANFLARSALIAAVNAGIEYSKLLSELVRLILFILVFAMALEQLDIAPNIILAAFVIFFGTIGAAAAVAFGAAGKEYAKKVIEYLLARRDRDNIDQL